MDFCLGPVQRNLADLQKTLSGEFNRKLQEWDKLKSQQVLLSGIPNPITGVAGAIGPSTHSQEGSLPHNFKKKLHEWEKIKEKEKDKVS